MRSLPAETRQPNGKPNWRWLSAGFWQMSRCRRNEGSGQFILIGELTNNYWRIWHAINWQNDRLLDRKRTLIRGRRRVKQRVTGVDHVIANNCDQPLRRTMSFSGDATPGFAIAKQSNIVVDAAGGGSRFVYRRNNCSLRKTRYGCDAPSNIWPIQMDPMGAPSSDCSRSLRLDRETAEIRQHPQTAIKVGEGRFDGPP